ncbi:MAG TPA: hypothetical protein VK644_11735 [Chitinophagaceae bacterium]|nr:hypothetical protein [Chitinophagaceae bacterium]
MKPIIRRSLAVLITLLAVQLGLSSFSSKKGGEGFEVYLNDKLLFQHYGTGLNTVSTVQLDRMSASDELKVKYRHCSEVGKGRALLIKDAQNNVLKEWHFKDVSSSDAVMTCSMKDILQLQSNKSKLGLYYVSNELKQGRLLVNFEPAG